MHGADLCAANVARHAESSQPTARVTRPRIEQQQRMAVTTHDRRPAATTSMLQRLAAWCYRRRRRVLVLWIVALIAAIFLGNAVGGSYSQSFSLAGAESQRATDVAAVAVPGPVG